MSTLLSFISSEDPFTSGLITGLNKPGPLLRLLTTKAFSQLAILKSPGLQQQTAEMPKVIEERFPHVSVHTQTLSAPNLNDMTRFIADLKSNMESCLKHLAHTGSAYIQVPQSMPELQSAITLLKATGTLDAELIQLEDSPYFSTPPQQP